MSVGTTPKKSESIYGSMTEARTVTLTPYGVCAAVCMHFGTLSSVGLGIAVAMVYTEKDKNTLCRDMLKRVSWSKDAYDPNLHAWSLTDNRIVFHSSDVDHACHGVWITEDYVPLTGRQLQEAEQWVGDSGSPTPPPSPPTAPPTLVVEYYEIDDFQNMGPRLVLLQKDMSSLLDLFPDPSGCNFSGSCDSHATTYSFPDPFDYSHQAGGGLLS